MSDLGSQIQPALRSCNDRPAEVPAFTVGAIAVAVSIGYVGWMLVESRSAKSEAVNEGVALRADTAATPDLKPVPTTRLTLDNADHAQEPTVINAHLEMPAGGGVGRLDDIEPMVRQLGFRALSESPENAAWLTGGIETFSETRGTVPIVSFPADR